MYLKIRMLSSCISFLFLTFNDNKILVKVQKLCANSLFLIFPIFNFSYLVRNLDSHVLIEIFEYVNGNTFSLLLTCKNWYQVVHLHSQYFYKTLLNSRFLDNHIVKKVFKFEYCVETPSSRICYYFRCNFLYGKIKISIVT